MKRALLIVSLAVCLATAVLSGFVFWGGSATRSPGSSLVGVTSKAALTTIPVPSAPPLLVSCQAQPTVSSSRALFRISGRCRLSTDGPAQCTASGGDDYGAYYGVKTTAGDAAYFSIGVEGYKGPGIYRTADVLFFVLYGVHLAQWQAPGSVVTITANSLVLPRTLLNAAPGTGATATVTARGTLPCTRA